jgi:prepilin-type N-terminal cleavage/methylation domain-containing protein
MRPNIRSTRGYSLIEILVVMGIIGVISLVTIPNFIAMYRGMKVKSGVRQLANDIRAARQEAVARYRPTMVTFGTSATERYSYWIYLWNPATTPPEWQLRKTAVLEPETALENRSVYFTGIGFADQSGPGSPPALDTRPDIIFEPTGAVRQTPVSPTLRIRTDADVGKNEYIVTVAPSGSVKVD